MTVEWKAAPDARRILVIEDHADLRELLTELLNAEGYTPEACADGRSAIERLDSLDGGWCVILDLHLPHVPGIEILRELRNRAALRDVPVIVTTADPHAMRDAAELNVRLVVKPFDVDDLIAEVRRACA